MQVVVDAATMSQWVSNQLIEAGYMNILNKQMKKISAALRTQQFIDI